MSKRYQWAKAGIHQYSLKLGLWSSSLAHTSFLLLWRMRKLGLEFLAQYHTVDGLVGFEELFNKALVLLDISVPWDFDWVGASCPCCALMGGCFCSTSKKLVCPTLNSLSHFSFEFNFSWPYTYMISLEIVVSDSTHLEQGCHIFLSVGFS